MNWTEQGFGSVQTHPPMAASNVSRFITASGMQYHNQALLRTYRPKLFGDGFSILSRRLMPLHVMCVGGHALHMRGTCKTVEPYTLDGKVCMIDRKCGLRVKVKVRVGKWVLYVFFFYFKKWRTLCGDATWPNPHGGSCDRGHETAWK